MPHRPSHGAISRVALLAAYSRMGPALRTDDSVHLASVLRAISARHMAPTSSATTRLATERLADPDVRRICRNRLLEAPPNAPPSEMNSYWDKIATPLHIAGDFACGVAPPDALKHWISDRTVELLKSRGNLPAGPEHHLMRRIVRRQVEVNVRADRETWWTQKVSRPSAPSVTPDCQAVSIRAKVYHKRNNRPAVCDRSYELKEACFDHKFFSTATDK
ncbi:ATP-binding cassette transporter [Clonorchis sinensis]|uniref:ATP-binding cassette transporter n=1 Tax=Clonorchis sinensis TaxID=79923 RepID=G7YFX4_CLOSI|nr:ATP-binding cassette transporter [Clonorchis sinensis]